MRRRDSDGGEARSVGSLLSAMLEEPMMRQGIERARLLDAFPGIAESILGQSASTNCRAIRVTDRVFIVEASDSIWGQRIQLMSRALLAALRNAGSPPSVTRIRTRLAPRKPAVRTAASTSAGSPVARCRRCGATSRSGIYCLACRAEADFWNTPPR